MKKITVTLGLILMLFATVFAQEEQKKTEKQEYVPNKIGISFYLGGVLPSLEMNDAMDKSLVIPGRNYAGKGGSAMFGASLGLKYNYIFKTKSQKSTGVGVFLSSDVLWNQFNKEMRTMYDTVKCTAPMYVNVPIMAGVNYTTQFSNVIALWVEVGAGTDLFIKTTEGWEGETNDYYVSAKFAAEAGAGILLARTLSLGAHYYYLGNHDIKEIRENSIDSKMKMGAWVFKLGFHF